jgi:hypothetical protein
MDLTEGSETSTNIEQTLGKHPKVNTVKICIVDKFVVMVAYEIQNPVLAYLVCWSEVNFSCLVISSSRFNYFAYYKPKLLVRRQ